MQQVSPKAHPGGSCPTAQLIGETRRELRQSRIEVKPIDPSSLGPSAIWGQPLQGSGGWGRPPESGAVRSLDERAGELIPKIIEAYRHRRERLLKQARELEVEGLEEEMAEIRKGLEKTHRSLRSVERREQAKEEDWEDARALRRMGLLTPGTEPGEMERKRTQALADIEAKTARLRQKIARLETRRDEVERKLRALGVPAPGVGGGEGRTARGRGEEETLGAEGEKRGRKLRWATQTHFTAKDLARLGRELQRAQGTREGILERLRRAESGAEGDPDPKVRQRLRKSLYEINRRIRQKEKRREMLEGELGARRQELEALGGIDQRMWEEDGAGAQDAKSTKRAKRGEAQERVRRLKARREELEAVRRELDRLERYAPCIVELEKAEREKATGRAPLRYARAGRELLRQALGTDRGQGLADELAGSAYAEAAACFWKATSGGARPGEGAPWGETALWAEALALAWGVSDLVHQRLAMEAMGGLGVDQGYLQGPLQKKKEGLIEAADAMQTLDLETVGMLDEASKEALREGVRRARSLLSADGAGHFGGIPAGGGAEGWGVILQGAQMVHEGLERVARPRLEAVEAEAP